MIQNSSKIYNGSIALALGGAKMVRMEKCSTILVWMRTYFFILAPGTLHFILNLKNYIFILNFLRACGFTENSLRWYFAQFWKLFLYITNRILEISFRISTHYSAFLFTHLIYPNPRDFITAYIDTKISVVFHSKIFWLPFYFLNFTKKSFVIKE